MNASHTIQFLVFILFFEVAYPFIFRASSSENTNTNTVTRNVLKKQNPSHQIVFPRSTAAPPNNTFTVKANFTSAPPRWKTTSVPSEELATKFLNSTIQENLYTAILNLTEAKLFNRTVENNTGSDSIVIENSESDRCSTGHDQQTSKKKNYLSDEYIRSKLCSNINSSVSREYRFDLDAKVCSQVGKQSHCGKNMIFYSHSGNILYGHCDCDHSHQIPLIYHPQTKRCYFMYQQGYCGKEEWLEMTKGNKTAICTTNKCFNFGRSSKFGAPPLAARDIPPEYVPLRGNGPCVKLNQSSKQYCKNEQHIVAFRWPLEFYPNCGPPPGVTGRFLGDVSSLDCSPGSYLNVMGTCEPDWEFD